MKANVTHAIVTTHRKPHLCFLFLIGLLALLTFSGTATAQCCGSVPNGFFEDMKLPPVQGGLVSDYLRCWQGSSRDVVITTDHPFAGPPSLGNWKIAMRGSNQGADGLSDAAITTSWIPVTPGKRYRLSGWLLRANSADNVYLDFNDGKGQGGNFQDAQAMATSAGVWEYRSVDVQVGPSTTAVQVRCVRDGANRGNAYFDGVTIFPLN